MWKPIPIKGKDDDFFRPWRSITLTEFLPRSFLDDHPKEVLEVTLCHVISIKEVDNNYASSDEIDRSNEIKQKTSVFHRIKTSNARSSVFQRLSMTTKEEKNQCPTSTFTWASTFKRLSISTSKKYQPSTFAFDCLKMSSDQHKREMETLKAKPFPEVNKNDEIHNHISSRMKKRLFVYINTKGSLTVKPRVIIFTNSTNKEGEQILDGNMSC